MKLNKPSTIALLIGIILFAFYLFAPDKFPSRNYQVLYPVFLFLAWAFRKIGH